MKNKYWSHKTVEIGKKAKIGKGTKIWHCSQVLDKANIGKNCTIGHNCLIGKKVRIGNNVKIQSNTDIWQKVTLKDYVFVGPSAVFTNDLKPRSKYPTPENKWLSTLVKEGATIGANATIVCGSVIGKWSMIGAGAVVADDVPDYAIVIGIPAKIIGWICECGNKLNFKKEKTTCLKCKRKYIQKGKRIRKI
jgi:UDP-2-acetamido-3-amino-2,3-dideoxy-glucuronate N-acetyltransferase